MKKVLFILSILALSVCFMSCEDNIDDRSIPYDETPTELRGFLTEHFESAGFSKDDIIKIEKDDDGEYEVKYRNGIEVDFYPNGVWKKIDVDGKPLPNSIAMLLPENALIYISATYPNSVIEEIEKTGRYSETGQGFKIEIKEKKGDDDDRDIYFDAVGNVLKDKGEESKGKETIKFEDLPQYSQDFLNTYFKDLVPKKIEKEWNKFEVEYENGIEAEVEFIGVHGKFKSIEVDDDAAGNDLIRKVILGFTGAPNILEYLDTEHSGQRIEEFSIAAAGITIEEGFVVEIDGEPDYKIYFDVNGNHKITIKD